MTSVRKSMPYQAGDRIRVLHSHATAGTVLGDVPVLRVVPLSDGRHFRVECERSGGGELHVVVDRAGKDAHGYVVGKAVASCPNQAA